MNNKETSPLSLEEGMSRVNGNFGQQSRLDHKALRQFSLDDGFPWAWVTLEGNFLFLDGSRLFHHPFLSL